MTGAPDALRITDPGHGRAGAVMTAYDRYARRYTDRFTNRGFTSTFGELYTAHYDSRGQITVEDTNGVGLTLNVGQHHTADGEWKVPVEALLADAGYRIAGRWTVNRRNLDATVPVRASR